MAVRTLAEIRQETVDGLDDATITAGLGAILDVFHIGPEEHGVQTSERDRAQQFTEILSIVSDVVLHTWSDARSVADE